MTAPVKVCGACAAWDGQDCIPMHEGPDFPSIDERACPAFFPVDASVRQEEFAALMAEIPTPPHALDPDDILPQEWAAYNKLCASFCEDVRNWITEFPTRSRADEDKRFVEAVKWLVEITTELNSDIRSLPAVLAEHWPGKFPRTDSEVDGICSKVEAAIAAVEAEIKRREE